LEIEKINDQLHVPSHFIRRKNFARLLGRARALLGQKAKTEVLLP
jgi:hypothetical protein